MSRMIRLAGWMAAANVVVVAAMLALAPAATSAARGFAAWCGIAPGA